MTEKKHIGTLVEDIYKMMEDGCEEIDQGILDRFAAECRTILETALVKRERTPRIRMSNVGRPSCQTWHEMHGSPREPLQGHTLIKFTYGHLIESLVYALAAAAGHEVGDRIEGEIDGVQGSSDPTIDGQLIDVKSCSSWAFNHKFTDTADLGTDDFGYYGQAAGYEAIGTKPFYGWLAVNKETGALRVSKCDREKIPDVHALINTQKASAAADAPIRAYEPVPFQKGGNMALSIACSYCAHKWACWPDLRSFLYSGKPTYLTHVEKLPKVDETTEQWRIK